MSALRRLGRHMRANVVAYLALFVALGGTSAYAANTIRSSDIVDGEVKTADIAENAITSNRINNGGIQNADFGTDSVTTSKIKAGNVGAGDLADGAVTPSKLTDGAVTPSKLAPSPRASVGSINLEVAHTAAGTILHPSFEIYDTDNLHAAGSEYLIAPVTGVYVVSAQVDWDPNGTGYRRTSILGVGDAAFASVAGPPLPSPAYTSQNPAGIEALAAGQGVRVQVLQGSGADLNARLVRFEMTLVGR